MGGERAACWEEVVQNGPSVSAVVTVPRTHPELHVEKLTELQNRSVWKEVEEGAAPTPTSASRSHCKAERRSFWFLGGGGGTYTASVWLFRCFLKVTCRGGLRGEGLIDGRPRPLLI